MDAEEPVVGAVRSARRRLWAADVACYYAQKRFSQTGKASDRQLWESCQREVKEAMAEVRAAGQAPAKGKV